MSRVDRGGGMSAPARQDVLTLALDLIAHRKHVQIRDPQCPTPIRIFAWWE
jgi:hypothetical protein